MSMESMDENIAQEGADWIAEMVSDDLGGFVPSELVDMLMVKEREVREAEDDAEMDHRTMATKLIPLFEAEGIPVKEGAVTPMLLEEILHWEDEFLAMAGRPRTVRASS